MSYQTYITDALVCGAKDSNTSDKSFLLFTREAGMLFASARSVRMEKSKQRFALQEFSLVRVTLIKGKSGWRLGSVEAIDNFYTAAIDKSARGSVVRIFRQLRRFIHGEEPAIGLFDFVLDALQVVTQTVTNRNFVDDYIHLHMLSLLGYVAERDVPTTLRSLSVNEYDAVCTSDLETQIAQLLSQAVAVSQL